jgi:hypothetical protein
MASHHRRQISIPVVRLSQPLPPLPSPSPAPNQALPLNNFPPQLSISTQIPYRDDPSDEDEEVADSAQSLPPCYEPMYDYLRSQRRPPTALDLAAPCPSNTNPEPPLEPYRDEPFIVQILSSPSSPSSAGPPPPSYHELYTQNENEMEMQLQNLVREFDMDGSPAEQTEELVKWVVSMLLIALTIACVGTAFNWGKPGCGGVHRC